MALTAKRITENFKELEDLNNEAFPKEERVSIERMIDLSKTGIADLYGVYDEDTFVGFFMTMTSDTCVYLFYLAIRSSLRSHGYGGRTLKLMDDLYQRQIVLDMEPLDSQADNYEQRLRRTKFYASHGYRSSGYHLFYWNQTFDLLCTRGSFLKDEFIEITKELQRVVDESGEGDFHPKMLKADYDILDIIDL